MKILQTKKIQRNLKYSTLSLFTFEILITTNYFDLSLRESTPSFIVSSSKYYWMNRYRFPKIFAAFERKIFNIEDATATCSEYSYLRSSTNRTINIKGGMALRKGIWNECGMAKRIKFRDIFFRFGAFLNFINFTTEYICIILLFCGFTTVYRTQPVNTTDSRSRYLYYIILYCYIYIILLYF